MKVAIGCDHAGFELKTHLAEVLRRKGHELVDVGATAYDGSDDYPDFAFAVADAVVEGRAERGIVVCGSGVGAAIAANKVSGVRACVCHDTYTAHQGVEHDDMNVLCLGGKVIGPLLAEELIAAYLGAEFSGIERHVRRVAKVRSREEGGARVTDG